MTKPRLSGIAAFSSHSAVQVVRGANEERLRALLFGDARSLRVYSRFPALKFEPRLYSGRETLNELGDLGFVLVPNGSVVEYVGTDVLKSARIPVFGSRRLLGIEASQRSKMQLLRDASIPVPKEYERPEEIDRPVIVKFPGAKGGRGYFVARSPEEVRSGIERGLRSGSVKTTGQAIIQEYLMGTTLYAHFFHSPIYRRTELTGFDVRYESDVDGLRRAPVNVAEGVSPTFTVVGNFPVFPRERLLETFIEFGERFVEAVKRVTGDVFAGPFSLECIVDRDLNVWAFEFSGRIVAGTNVYLFHGSPYLALYFDVPITVGRRIAMELRIGAETDSLQELLT
ncbi:MAG: formate--phosphoribosylaminoimidazolecarboxamide ligase [Thaumarchaeota archaeon]|nr:formate--phosphoribosylaminoimidazolecarboxamide ligase [Candidatus Calditenuaceae archaeon]MDW8187118.1 formate--phosphoribosylaminoimidazolecarboxamide ligase [Nitrososphaerota archaeon]